MAEIKQGPPVKELSFEDQLELWEEELRKKTNELKLEEITNSIRNSNESNKGKLGNQLMQKLSNLPIIKHLGDYNEDTAIKREYINYLSRTGQMGIINQGLQHVNDALGTVIGLPFKGLEEVINTASDVTNVDSRYIGAIKDAILIGKGTKISKTSPLYRNIQNLKTNIRHGNLKYYKGSTSSTSANQGLLSSAVNSKLAGIQTKGAIKPGFVKDASGKLVSPGWDTGYRTYLAKGGLPENYGIASQAKNMLRDKVDEMIQAKTGQRTRYEQRISAGQAELKYIKDMQRSDLTVGQKRNIRADVPPHVKKWAIDTQGLEAYKAYRRWLRDSHTTMEYEKDLFLKDQLPKNITPAIEHTTSLKGDKSKQLDKTSPLAYSYKDPTTGTYKPVTQRGADDPTAKFIGSSYRNVHQGAADAYTSDQMALLDIPQNWEQSAAYYFGFNQFNAGKRLSHSDWMALQSKELSAEQLFSGEKAVNQNIAQNIKDIHKVEEGVSIKNRYHPDSTHRKKLSKEKRQIEELTWVDPKNYITIKLDRNGNIIPPTVPVEIAPGIMVGPNYKPGNDIALDAVIKKLITDGPSSLDSSGLGGRTNISDRD